jgi:uncharacterized protein (DUF58 family)
VSAQATFPLIPRRRVIGLAFGSMRSARRGLGSDVASSRPYRPGDRLDAIDWAASARLALARDADEFIVREHYAEESPRALVVADRRPTLALGPPPERRLRKADALEYVVGLISASAVAARSLLGYLDYSDGVPFWQPPRSEHQQTAPANRGFGAPDDSLAQALAFLDYQRGDLPTGTFVFVVSDFLEPVDRRAWARMLERRWDAVPVVIQDPLWERSFPHLHGLVVPFADPRTGKVASVRLGWSEARQLRESNERRWGRLLADFRSVGLEPIVVDSHEPAEISAAFFRWADERIYVRGQS